MAEPAATEGSIQEELDRRLFYLKTLYDMSCELFGIMEVGRILKHFLLMTTGNFGVIEGFILLMDPSSGKIEHVTTVGIAEHEKSSLTKYAWETVRKPQGNQAIFEAENLFEDHVLSRLFALVLPFEVDGGWNGVVGIGHRIVGKPYSSEDKNLLLF